MENVQEEIRDVHQKLDTVLEYLQEQKQQRQIIEDLVQDVSIVGTDIFKYSVDELDKQGIVIDGEQVKLLLFRGLKNIENLSNMLETLNSISDLIKDASPVINEVIIDTTRKLAELENQGVFASVQAIAKNLSNALVLQRLENITGALVNVKPDQKLDDKSLWKLFKELKSKEVRSSLSYLLRVVKASQINLK